MIFCFSHSSQQLFRKAQLNQTGPHAVERKQVLLASTYGWVLGENENKTNRYDKVFLNSAQNIQSPIQNPSPSWSDGRTRSIGRWPNFSPTRTVSHRHAQRHVSRLSQNHGACTDIPAAADSGDGPVDVDDGERRVRRVFLGHGRRLSACLSRRTRARARHARTKMEIINLVAEVYVYLYKVGMNTVK
jgi:hypothetical protein